MGVRSTKLSVKRELSTAQIQYLESRTRMTEEEIQKWFRKFIFLLLFHFILTVIFLS